MVARSFKASEALLPYIEDILKRRGIEYKVGTGFGEEVYITAKISGSAFHKIVVRASCEKYRKDNNYECLIIAKSEERNPATLRLILKEYNTSNYITFE